MSVSVKYAGDKDVIVGRAGGSALFRPFSVATPPPYGTLINTLYGYEYPIAQGGSYLTWNTANYPTQTVTVDELADGAWGTFLDWSGKRDAAFKTYGTVFAYDSGTYYVTVDGVNYSSGSYSQDVAHDGSGSYTFINNVTNWVSSGTFITFVASGHSAGNLEVPSGSGTYYHNTYWDGYNYYHDGSGGTYAQDGGSSFPLAYGNVYVSYPNQAEVPVGSGSWFNNGTYTDYIADGFYGYTTTSSGSYISYGTFIKNTIYYDTGSTEVPSGSGNYFNSQWFGDKWYWDGMGGYYANTNTYYYDYGTFIYNDGTYSYYWDGSGGFYI